MKSVAFLLLAVSLAACSSATRDTGNRNAGATATVAFATGPISRACMASDRRARSEALCGCIQAAADRTLSSAEQSRAVRFYNDPHRAQEIRQSDNPGDERFWENYREYGDTATRMCRSVA